MRSFFDKVHSSLETAIMEKKLVLAVSGYPELYEFIYLNYHDLNKKPGGKLMQHFEQQQCGAPRVLQTVKRTLSDRAHGEKS